MRRFRRGTCLMGKSFRTTWDPKKIAKRSQPGKVKVTKADGSVETVGARSFLKEHRPPPKKGAKTKAARRPSHSQEYLDYMASAEWANLRRRVLVRDHGLCRMCRRQPKFPHVHHITYERFGHEDLADLVTLCPVCHSNIHWTIGGSRA